MSEKLTRKEQRIEVIKRLYEMDMNRDFTDCDSEYPYIEEILEGVSEKMDRLDDTISDNLQKWSLNRLTFIDRAIFRCAVYEMIYTQTPSEIIINEALNITKEYSDEGDGKMVGFVNRVLDNIKIALKK